jgi:oxygen-dependent protoporphyrinogen oxidase
MRLAVVGGGMAGLAAAWEAERIAERDELELTIDLYEASDRVGGKVWTVREDGFVVEAGADAVVRYKPWALELAGELGLEPVSTLPAEPAALVVRGGKARPLPAGLNLVVPADVRALARSRLLSTRARARALADLLLPRGPGRDEPAGAFLTRRLGRGLWEELAAPLLGGVYGGDPYDLSTEAALPQLLELERRHRSLILGSRRLVRRRPAAHGGAGVFASFGGGLGSLPETLVGALARTDVRLGREVARLEELDADAVVLAIPAHSAAGVLSGAAPEAAAALAEIRYADAPTVTLAFEGARLTTPAGHGLLFAANEGEGIRGFTWVDRKWAGRAPSGDRLVRAFATEDQAGLGDHELVRLVRAALERIAGPLPAHERAWVFRWSRGLPQYRVGHAERLRRIESALERLPYVRLAGAGYRGVGVPDVVRDGRAATRSAIAATTPR